MIAYDRLRATARALVLPLLIAGIASGCDEQVAHSAEEYLQRAKQQHAEGEIRAAIVNLKNALQQEPQNADARVTLGRVYVSAGDGAAAEKEIVIARNLGERDEVILPLLGRAWLLQNKTDQLLKEFRDPDGQPARLRAAIQVLRGEALRRHRQFPGARAAFEDALAAYKHDIEVERPHLALTAPAVFAEAETGLAKVAIDEQKWDEATARITAAHEAAPDDPDVLGVAGILAFEQREYAAAEEAFAKAHERQRYNALLQIRLAHAQIAQGKTGDAIGNLDAVLAAAPDHPFTNYLRGLAAYLDRDYGNAKAFSEKAIKLNRQLDEAHMIAGASDFALGQYEQANRYLVYYLSKNPRNAAARRLLGAAQLRLGNAQEAYATLQPLTGEAQPADAEVLSMIGQAAYRAGEFERARGFMQKAVDTRPDDSRLRAQLGMTRVALGDKEGGFQELERAITSDPSLTQAETQLVVGYIRSGELEKAAEAIARLKEKSPDSPLPYNLQAMNLLAQEDLEGAKAALRQALEKDQADATANLNLAKMLVLGKEFDEARTLYGRLLQARPGMLQAMVGMAELETFAGNRNQAFEWLRETVRLNQDAVGPRVALMRAYFSANEAQRAVDLGSGAPLNAFEDPAFLETYAEAQLATGRTSAAAVTARRLAELAPDSADAAFIQGRAALAAGDMPAARAAFEKVISLEPENYAAKLERAKIASLEADYERAKEIVAELEGKAPDTRAFLALKSSIAVAERRYDDAVALQQEIVRAWPDTNALLSLSDLQWQLGNRDDAIATLEGWLERFPTDGMAEFKLGQRYLDAERLDDAGAVFSRLVERVPDSPTAQNNLAWVLFQQGHLDRARTHAERAHRLAPQAGPIIDTYTRVLLEQGRAADALPILEGATRRQPDNRGLRFLQARATAEAGRPKDAKRLLDRLLQDDAQFAERAEAEALHKTLAQQQ